MKDKLLYLVSFFIIGIAFFGILLGTFWKVYPYKVIDIKTHPMLILTKQVKAGGVLVYQVNYCKYMDISASVVRTFIDDVQFASPTITGNRSVGCNKINNEMKVPESLFPDTYQLEVKYIYQVNPIRTIEVKTFTEPFEVVK